MFGGWNHVAVEKGWVLEEKGRWSELERGSGWPLEVRQYLDVTGRKTGGVDPSPCADLETVCGLGSTR